MIKTIPWWQAKESLKKLCGSIKGESILIPQQMRQQRNKLMGLKGKRKRNITNVNKVFAVILVKKINQ